jgi:hypothetical protein
MIVETTGTVNYVKVGGSAQAGDDLGFTQIQQPGQPLGDFFVLWWGLAERQPVIPTDWLIRAMQVSLLREAVAGKLAVTIQHEQNSPFVINVRLGT